MMNAFFNTILSGNSTSVMIENQNQLDNLTFESGKTYKFKSGIEFYINRDISVNNITLKSSGIGRAILKGSKDLSQDVWIDEGNNIYSITPTDSPLWIYVEGQNSKMCETEWINTVSKPASNQLEILPGDISFDPIGGSLIGKPNIYWLSREYNIINYNSGVITLDRNHELSSGNDIKILNLQSLLSNDYDWCIDSGTIYIKLPSAPINYTINSVIEDYGLNIGGNNVKIDNIEFKNFFEAAIYNNGDDIYNCVITGCKLHDCREDAVRFISKSTNILFQRNTVYETGACGVYFTNINTLEVYDNIVYNIGTQANYGWLKEDRDVTNRPPNVGTGIFQAGIILDPPVDGQNIFINNNIIYNTAYTGITVSTSSVITINYNIVHDFMLKFGDGGGIYTYYYFGRYPDYMDNVEIAYNKIYDYNQGDYSAGIYNDNGSANINAHHNIVYGDGINNCLRVNPGTSDTKYEDNIFICSDSKVVDINNIAFHSLSACSNFIFNRNILAYINDSTQDNIGYTYDCFPPNGEADNNYYFRPYDSNSNISNFGNLAALQSTYGEDTNSLEKANWLTYVDQSTAEEDIKLYTNETDTDTTIIAPSGYEDIDGNDVSLQELTVPAHYGLLILKS